MLIYLIGLMGSGKSYFGERWAAQHHLSFYDLDKLIETAEGKTIKQIFEQNGEAYFRKIEASILRETSKFQNSIISCGGGTPCFSDNIEWMNTHGTTVFLDTAINKVFENVLPEKAYRPLIAKLNKDEIIDFLKEQLQSRLPFYNKSKITLEIDKITDEDFRSILQNIKHA
jgi:shikimate kinase